MNPFVDALVAILPGASVLIWLSGNFSRIFQWSFSEERSREGGSFQGLHENSEFLKNPLNKEASDKAKILYEKKRKVSEFVALCGIKVDAQEIDPILKFVFCSNHIEQKLRELRVLRPFLKVEQNEVSFSFFSRSSLLPLLICFLGAIAFFCSALIFIDALISLNDDDSLNQVGSAIVGMFFTSAAAFRSLFILQFLVRQ